jgi:thymidylate synthase
LKHVKISAFDCPDAWFKTLYCIWKLGDNFDVLFGSEVSKTKKLNLTLEISHPENRPLVSDKAPCDMKYVQWYALAYLWSGEKQEETYTYGSRLRDPVDQIEEAVRRYVELRQDRQVTLVIRQPDDIQSGRRLKQYDPPCLSIIDTEVMDNKMNLTCYFRSWDAYAGLPANIAGLQLFNEAFVSEINSRGDLSIETGSVVFHSKNCHIYERQYKLVAELMDPQSQSNKNQISKILKEIEDGQIE